MTEPLSVVQAVALSAGLAWASGLRLYLVLFLAGLLSHLGYLQLPDTLELLRHPLVMGASGLLLVAETVADKVPGFDSFWDSLQTFVRIPAGALLAAFSLGVTDPALVTVAGLIGGTITAGTALSKAGGRLAINTSPEPFSNWTASVSEEAAVLGGFWLMLAHPWVFLGLLALFLLLLVWLLPKLWRFVRGAIGRIAAFFRAGGSDANPPRV
ncbi:MAG TPA: DUF4126 domain-containing protein [Azospira sp.]|nr:DUF4126 domain-containing protein [Azospira sp.]HNN46968.1 DUF4126 domain-containing protein [Azospira sp.]